jgi:hypothetical protein
VVSDTHCLASPTLTTPSESPEKADQLIEKQFGQDVIDSLSVLEAIVPTFHPDLHPKFTQIFPMLELALRSQFAIIRQCAAKCFATVCDVMPDQALKYIVEHVIPLVPDPMSLANRQGAIELIYRESFMILVVGGFLHTCRGGTTAGHQGTPIRHFPCRANPWSDE